jgi:hypothetical protein
LQRAAGPYKWARTRLPHRSKRHRRLHAFSYSNGVAPLRSPPVKHIGPQDRHRHHGVTEALAQPLSYRLTDSEWSDSRGQA